MLVWEGVGIKGLDSIMVLLLVVDVGNLGLLFKKGHWRCCHMNTMVLVFYTLVLMITDPNKNFMVSCFSHFKSIT